MPIHIRRDKIKERIKITLHKLAFKKDQQDRRKNFEKAKNFFLYFQRLQRFRQK